jgi:hypothetical protein
MQQSIKDILSGHVARMEKAVEDLCLIQQVEDYHVASAINKVIDRIEQARDQLLYIISR